MAGPYESVRVRVNTAQAGAGRSRHRAGQAWGGKYMASQVHGAAWSEMTWRGRPIMAKTYFLHRRHTGLHTGNAPKC